MSTLERAIEIAARAHKGQTDKAQQPYILHPLRVMLAVKTPEKRMAAVLHDVVEDTSTTLKALIDEGFPLCVIEAVQLLTKIDGEEKIEAAKHAKRNPIAKKVKIEDVKDNLNIDRIKNPSKNDHDRFIEYEKVLLYLTSDE